MKLFFIKLSIFLVGLAFLFSIKTFYLLSGDRYKKIVLGVEIYHSIEKSKKRNKKAKTLVIGDSVGQQLFKNDKYNDSICSLTCNQAISLAGQYFLLENFLKVNPEVKKVILIYTPKSFKNNLDQQYTFQYFLKPFYNSEFRSRFSSSMNEQVKKISFYYLSQFPPVLTSNWSPGWDFSNETNDYYMAPLSKEYLTKIIQLCNDYAIKFIILPTPLKPSYLPIVTDFSKNIAYNDYNFKYYFSRITYIPDSCFLDDVHLKHPQEFVGAYIKIIDNL